MAAGQPTAAPANGGRDMRVTSHPAGAAKGQASPYVNAYRNPARRRPHPRLAPVGPVEQADPSRSRKDPVLLRHARHAVFVSAIVGSLAIGCLPDNPDTGAFELRTYSVYVMPDPGPGCGPLPYQVVEENWGGLPDCTTVPTLHAPERRFLNLWCGLPARPTWNGEGHLVWTRGGNSASGHMVLTFGDCTATYHAAVALAYPEPSVTLANQ
jgi:hypothetical protein